MIGYEIITIPFLIIIINSHHIRIRSLCSPWLVLFVDALSFILAPRHLHGIDAKRKDKPYLRNNFQLNIKTFSSHRRPGPLVPHVFYIFNLSFGFPENVNQALSVLSHPLN